MRPDLTPAFRAYARGRLARLGAEDPVESQRRTLVRLIRRAATTRFGQAHGFARLATPGAFQRAVPLRRYEAFWSEWWRPAFPALADATWPGQVPFLALTSGTSAGRTKFIPVTRAMERSNRRAALDVLVHHFAARPDTRLFAGRSFMLGGSTALRDEGEGVRSGDLSGIAAARVPGWARPFFFPPRRIALIEDWERKIDVLAARSPGANVRSINGTPSWLLLFLERLAATRPDLPRRLDAFYPDLELLVHGGVAFAPYRDRFAPWLAGGRVLTREVYPASEGFFAVADRGPDEGMRLLTDTGIFHEFVPVDEIDHDTPTRLWLADVEPGRDYALLVSSCAGLWAYVVGDVVRLVSRDPPRVRVVGRVSDMLSAYGEHVTGEEIARAVLAGAGGRGMGEYAVGAEDAGAAGRHVFVVEAGGDADAFSRVADEVLMEANDDYRAHRAGGQMLPPRVVLAPAGAFTVWMRGLGKLGGQNKVPRVITDPALLGSLLDSVGDGRISAGDGGRDD